MDIRHASQLWQRFPSLAAGVITADVADLSADDEGVRHLVERAATTLADRNESELPQIAAWRRVYSTLGLKPTKYRCAAESLLRRYRLSGEFPRVHPVVDLCNATSMAYGIPVAAFDTSKIIGGLVVREADGTEEYETFAGTVERPMPGEVIFADDAGLAHARRWATRQSARSAVSTSTREVLIVAEAHHDSAAQDVHQLITELGGTLARNGGSIGATGMLTMAAPRLADLPSAGAD